MSEEKKEKKKKGLNPLIIVIVVLLLAVVGLAAYFLVLKKAPTPGPYVPVAIVETSWSAGDFLVNLADKDTDRYLKATIVLTYDETDKTLGTDMDGKKYAIRDTIISVIRSKLSTDIATPKGADILKSDIVKGVNRFLGGSKIINVYYNDVLIQ